MQPTVSSTCVEHYRYIYISITGCFPLLHPVYEMSNEWLQTRACNHFSHHVWRLHSMHITVTA